VRTPRVGSEKDRHATRLRGSIERMSGAVHHLNCATMALVASQYDALADVTD
jgi:hypothetical protein